MCPCIQTHVILQNFAIQHIFFFFLKATLKTNCNYIQSWLTQLTVSKYISRGLWGLFVFWGFVVGRFFGFCFGGGFLPNLCHMHVILCYECQTRLSIEECRCLYGTLLGKITVILSLDLEKTSLSYSWKSAQTQVQDRIGTLFIPKL